MGFKQVRFKMLLVAATLSLCGVAHAGITVQMNTVDEKGTGKSVGRIVVSETPYGLVFTPSLAGLPPGLHGFHVHENPSCGPRRRTGRWCRHWLLEGITIRPEASATACLGVMDISVICLRCS